MKLFSFILMLTLLAGNFAYSAEPRQIGDFRGVFARGKEKFAVTITHEAPKDLAKTQKIRYHVRLEQGCQEYTGTAWYSPGRLLIMAESMYISEGMEKLGLDHFDILQLQCDLDEKGIITETRLILPDGVMHKMTHDVKTPSTRRPPEPTPWISPLEKAPDNAGGSAPVPPRSNQ